jgi:hypothetical protein
MAMNDRKRNIRNIRRNRFAVSGAAPPGVSVGFRQNTLIIGPNYRPSFCGALSTGCGPIQRLKADKDR